MKPLKGKLAYKIGKNIQQIDNELILYNKARYKILEQYCVKDENNNIQTNSDDTVIIPNKNINDYNEEIKKLDETNVELNITLLDLDDFESIELTPKQIMDIEWLIKKEEA